MTTVGQARLYAPASYWRAPNEVRARICNGAGPRNFGWAVPDTIYGLRITDAADVHDWMYWKGTTIDAKREADRVFLNNMLRIIETDSGRWLKWFRIRRALKYYWAVSTMGGPAFWAGKNQPETMGTT